MKSVRDTVLGLLIMVVMFTILMTAMLPLTNVILHGGRGW